MKKRNALTLSTALVAGLLLSACGAPRMPMMSTFARGPMFNAANTYRADNTVRGTLTPNRPKEEATLLDRHVTVQRSAFDDQGDRQRSRRPVSDSLFSKPQPRQPLDNVAGQLPYATYTDLRDYLRNSALTTFEDFKFFEENNGRTHFNRYINGAYREIQKLYSASREEMKRFILLDVLVNSLTVSGQALSYQDIHHPAPTAGNRMTPTQAAQVMPTFGELVVYNLSSNDVNYQRWDLRTAARYYQSNYARLFSLIMEFGPSKQDAWRLIHREITTAAGN